MPTYSYTCRECGRVQTLLRPMSRSHDYPDCTDDACEGETYLSLNDPPNWERGSGWASRMDGAPKPGTVERT